MCRCLRSMDPRPMKTRSSNRAVEIPRPARVRHLLQPGAPAQRHRPRTPGPQPGPTPVRRWGTSSSGLTGSAGCYTSTASLPDSRLATPVAGKVHSLFFSLVLPRPLSPTSASACVVIVPVKHSRSRRGYRIAAAPLKLGSQATGPSLSGSNYVITMSTGIAIVETSCQSSYSALRWRATRCRSREYIAARHQN